MGLTAELLHLENPQLILCDISGYGNDGPYRDKKAYDLLIQSEAGFLSVTGTLETPSKAGNSIADIAAGMYAYSNILAAILQRGKTGKGSAIDVSMLESLAEWMSYPLYYAYEGAAPPSRNGASHATIYPYGPFKTGDGGTVMLGLQNDREWDQFCQVVLEDEALAKDDRFDKNFKRNEKREQLLAIIDASSTLLKLPMHNLMTCQGYGNMTNFELAIVGLRWLHPVDQFQQCFLQAQTIATLTAWIPYLL